jgi:hypothetical protein
MIGRGVIAVAVLVTAGTATPALACTIIAARGPTCSAGSGCTPALVAQLRRDRAQREAIEYGRAMAQAVDRRSASPALDRSYDLARILMPNMVAPVASREDSCDGWTAEDEDREGQHDSIEVAEAVIRGESGMAADAPVDFALVSGFAARRTQCNAEIRRDLGAYLTSALPSEQLRDLWDFLVPRAGATVPIDGAQEIGGARLLIFGEDGALRIPDGEGGGPPHIASRRERAGEYLANHRNGRAVMSALNQFVAARVANGRSEAALCPVTMRGQV